MPNLTKDKLESIFKATPSPFLVLLPDAPKFTIVDVNAAYLEATNTKQEDLIGRGIFEAFPENPDEENGTGVNNLRSSLLQVVSSGTPHKMAIQKYDIPIRGTNRFEVRYWSPQNVPVTNKTNNIEYIIHSAFDVTEKVVLLEKEAKTKTKLLSNKKKYQSLFEYNQSMVNILESMGDAFVSLDKNYRYTYVNENALRLMNKTKEELIGKSLWVVFPDILGTTFELEYRKVMEERIPATFEIHYPSYNMWLSVRSYPLDEGISIFYSDISEKKKADETLLKSKEKLEQSLSELSHINYAVNQHSIVAVTDTKGTILHVNDKFCEISKYSEKELLENNHRMLNSGYHPKEFFVEMYKTIFSGKVWKNEICNKAKDGSLFWVHTTIVPFIDQKTGKPIQFIAVRTDITKQKRDKQHLVSLNEELKKRADELAISNAELEQFAYVASHDLQEPLRMVTSFLTRIEQKFDKDLDEKAHKYIFFAKDGALRMRKIILDLLEYSRIGKKSIQLESVDMNDLMSEIVQMNQVLISENEAIITWEKLPTIKCAKTQMQQIVQNLIGNALKYKKTGVNPVIKIHTSEDSTHWKFSISDNGIGIEPQFFQKIFIVFQRLHNKAEYSGTGIGLAICKKIAESHGGKIWVESTPNEGSTFHFTISKNNSHL